MPTASHYWQALALGAQAAEVENTVSLFREFFDSSVRVQKLRWNKPLPIRFAFLSPFVVGDCGFRQVNVDFQNSIAVRAFVAVQCSIRNPDTRPFLIREVSASPVLKTAFPNHACSLPSCPVIEDHGIAACQNLTTADKVDRGRIPELRAVARQCPCHEPAANKANRDGFCQQCVPGGEREASAP